MVRGTTASPVCPPDDQKSSPVDPPYPRRRCEVRVFHGAAACEGPAEAKHWTQTGLLFGCLLEFKDGLNQF